MSTPIDSPSRTARSPAEVHSPLQIHSPLQLHSPAPIDSPHLFCSVMDQDVCYACRRKQIMRSFYSKFSAARDADLDRTLEEDSHLQAHQPSKIREWTMLKKNDTAKRKSTDASKVGASFLPNIPALTNRTCEGKDAGMVDDVRCSRHTLLPKIGSTSVVTTNSTDANGNSFSKIATDGLRLPPIQEQSEKKKPNKRELKKKYLHDFVQRELAQPFNTSKKDVGATTKCLPSIDGRVRTLHTPPSENLTPLARRVPALSDWKTEVYENMRSSENFPNLLESLMNDMEESQRLEREMERGEIAGGGTDSWKKLLIAKHERTEN